MTELNVAELIKMNKNSECINLDLLYITKHRQKKTSCNVKILTRYNGPNYYKVVKETTYHKVTHLYKS